MGVKIFFGVIEGMPISQGHVFWASIIAFTILNLVENLIHYNIGREQDRHTFSIHFNMPSLHDLVKLGVIMLVFAILQGVLVVILDKTI